MADSFPSIIPEIGNLFFQTACSTQDFILVADIRSIAHRYPGSMDVHDGFYGLGVVNVLSMITTLFAPCLINCIKSKWISFNGVLLALLYFISFQFLERWIYFVACGILGIGLSVYNVGNEGSLLESSTVSTLDRNHSFSNITNCLATFLSGVIYIIITIMYNEQGIATDYRSYSDIEITHFYETFAIVCGISMIVFAASPNEDVEGNIASMDKPHTKWAKEIGSMMNTLVDKRILSMIPFFIYNSLFRTLWVSVIPAALHYIDSLSEVIYITAYFSMSFAIGSLAASLITLQLSEKFVDFAMRPLLIFSALIQFLIYAWMVLMIPKNSTIEPTSAPALFIQPSMIPLLIFSSLFGMAETANATTRTMLCARLIPNKKHQVFGVARFYSSLAASAVFFASPSLSVYAYGAILVLFLAIASGSFLYTSTEVKMYEKAIDSRFPVIEVPPKRIVITRLQNRQHSSFRSDQQSLRESFSSISDRTERTPRKETWVY